MKNIQHYLWKRTLARQALSIPGNFYPEDRFLRVFMLKEGLEQAQLFETTSFKFAFSLTSQVKEDSIVFFFTDTMYI